MSELATNALIHAPGPVGVRISHRRGTVRLEVADTSGHHPAANPDADVVHGRGLSIVGRWPAGCASSPIQAPGAES